MSHLKIIVICLMVLVSAANSQNSWQRHAGGPVVPVWAGNINDPSSYKYTYEPSVLYDSTASMYKMWFVYQAYGFGVSWSIGHAVSYDGVNWFVYSKNPVLGVGHPGAFDRDGVVAPCVIRVANTYIMYYQGYYGSPAVWQVGVATSTDGTSWTKYSGNPVLTVRLGTFESVAVGASKVVFDESQYLMFYSGFNGTVYEIGLATSTDGFAWTRNLQNPVLRRGVIGSWDQASVTTNAIFVKQGIYYLFYGGGPFAPIGYATSTNGVEWTKYIGNPVFSAGSPGSWDASRVEYGTMVLQGNVLKYWYSGFGYSSALGQDVWQIGHATSNFVTSAQEIRRPTPTTYLLEQSSPNPFNPETEIRFSIPTNEFVVVKVFDGLGKELQTLMSEQKPAGSYTLRWKPESAASGVYYYRMTVGSFIGTKKWFS